MAVKGLIASIVQLLTQQLEEGDLSADSRESLEVAIQCLESAYGVQASDAVANVNLLEIYKETVDSFKPDFGPPATPEAKLEAESLKNEGNSLMKAERHTEAIDNYSKAIKLDGRNAVYYCNRAAAHSKIGNHAQALRDCRMALAIDPSYSKVYGRLGLAYSHLGKYKEAKESYQKALEMEPGNEIYKTNLQVVEEKMAQGGAGYMLGNNAPGNSSSNVDLSSLLSNPALRNMARLMLGDPSMQTMMTELMNGNVEQGGRMEALIEVGQQLAQQMQTANPELIDSLRRQMGGNPNDPEPPQDN